MSELPELTPEEKHAIDSLDMTASLGTWKEQYQNAHDVAIKYMRKCREQQAEIKRLRAELQIVTKSRDHYMGEFDRFDKGYWVVVAERNKLREAICNPCNFAAPCGNCEACEKTKQALAGGE